MLYPDAANSKNYLLNCKLFEMSFPSLGASWSSNYIALFLLPDQMSKKFIHKKGIIYHQLLNSGTHIHIQLNTSTFMSKEMTKGYRWGKHAKKLF